MWIFSIATCAACAKWSTGASGGQIDAVYQLGHPIGFQNQIYAGETHFCRLCSQLNMYSHRAYLLV
jgi:hypothetical protein